MALVDADGGSTKTKMPVAEPWSPDVTLPKPTVASPSVAKPSTTMPPRPATSTSTLSWLAHPITQGFGPTNEPRDSGGFNKGYDFGMPIGTPIESNINGRVIDVSDDPNNSSGWGVYVWVQDDAGYIHRFGHLDRRAVNVGDIVHVGDLLGASGNTGKGYNYASPWSPNETSTGPHLSYDVSDRNGNFVDPGRWLANFGAGDINARVPTSEGIWGEDIKDAPLAPQAPPSEIVRRALMDYFQQMPTMQDPENAELVKDGEYATIEEAYTSRFSIWASNVTMMQQVMNEFGLSENDIWEMPDGTLVPLSSLPPELQSQIATHNQNNWAMIQNKFALDQYGLQLDAAKASFAAAVDIANLKMGYEDRDLARQTARVNRQIAGMAESRQRTDMLVDAIMALAPKATLNGKTEFTPNDAGAIGREFAQFAGIGPDEVALRYQGTTRVDPGMILSAIDQAMGVGGPLAEIGESTLSLADLLPQYAPPSIPGLTAPVGYQPIQFQPYGSDITNGITGVPAGTQTPGKKPNGVLSAQGKQIADSLIGGMFGWGDEDKGDGPKWWSWDPGDWWKSLMAD